MKKISLLMFFPFIVLSLMNNYLFAQTQLKLINTISGIPASNLSQILRGDFENIFDIDSDGKPDQVFLKNEPTPTLVVMKGGNDNITLENYFLPEIGDEVLFDFKKAKVLGFFKMDLKDNLKEIIVAEKSGHRYINPIVINSEDDYTSFQVESFGANVVFVATGDTNDDGFYDILIFNPDSKEVQIWGY